MKQSMILNRAYNFALMLIEKEERHGDLLAQLRCERLNNDLDELHDMILKAESEERGNDKK